jgi:hypothetical protein
MKRLGINIQNYDIENYRKINDENMKSVLKERKYLVYKAPEQNIFYTPGPDNRELILKKMKKEIDSALVTKLDPRPDVY